MRRIGIDVKRREHKKKECCYLSIWGRGSVTLQTGHRADIFLLAERRRKKRGSGRNVLV